MITIHLPTINKMIRRSLSASFFPGFLLVICENVFEKEWNLNGNSFSAATSVYRCLCLPTTLITFVSSYSCSRSCYFLRWPFDPVIRILEKRSVQFSASLNFRICRVFDRFSEFPFCFSISAVSALPSALTIATNFHLGDPTQQNGRFEVVTWSLS